jgi:hypothetical protein
MEKIKIRVIAAVMERSPHLAVKTIESGGSIALHLLSAKVTVIISILVGMAIRQGKTDCLIQLM